MKSTWAMLASVGVVAFGGVAEAQYPSRVEVEMRLWTPKVLIWGEPTNAHLLIRNTGPEVIPIGLEARFLIGIFEVRRQGEKSWKTCKHAASRPDESIKVSVPFGDGLINGVWAREYGTRPSGLYPGETWSIVRGDDFSDFDSCFSEMTVLEKLREIGTETLEIRFLLCPRNQVVNAKTERCIPSNVIAVEVKSPKGVDLEAMLDESVGQNWKAPKWPDSLYIKYPTSIYVGHELMKTTGQLNQVFGRRGTMPMDYVARRPGEQNRLSLARDAKPDVVHGAELEDAYEKTQVELRVGRLATFLVARPEFSEADSLRLELAGRFASLGRFDEAKRQVQLLSKPGATPERDKALDAFRKFMEDKQGFNGGGGVPN
jgi:hypothetical protein